MKCAVISLGCDKNLVDSEKMLGLLAAAGHEFTDDESEAECIIVNTCCFIGDAKEESINTIIEMGRMKEEGRCRLLLVTGCLAERYREEVLTEMPEVDGILGTSSWDEILRLIDEAEGPSLSRDVKKPQIFAPLSALPRSGKRVLSTGGHYAYLKIAEGCDKRCTYCVIPSVRGAYRSVPMEELAAEAQTLAQGGVKELILVAQETTLYGKDLYGRKALPDLLKRLAAVEGIAWIRLLYGYPEEITPELVAVMKEEPKICHYLDIPIQHCTDRILSRMGRRTTKAHITEQIARLREEIPDICLRTTFISGFPGETQEDHEELAEFIDRTEFDRVGVFAYSPEEGTPAASMPDQVPDEVKQERRDELMALQQEVSADLCRSHIGEELTVMIEGKLADEPVYAARSYRDAPGVDGYVFVRSPRFYMSGDFVRVRVTAAEEYDLIGEVIE